MCLFSYLARLKQKHSLFYTKIVLLGGSILSLSCRVIAGALLQVPVQKAPGTWMMLTQISWQLPHVQSPIEMILFLLNHLIVFLQFHVLSKSARVICRSGLFVASRNHMQHLGGSLGSTIFWGSTCLGMVGRKGETKPTNTCHVR